MGLQLPRLLLVLLVMVGAETAGQPCVALAVVGWVIIP